MENIKELQEKKEELITKIHLQQVESKGFFDTKTFYETEIKNKIQRQNDIFQELKKLEGEIIEYDKLAMKFHNQWVNSEWHKNKLEEEKDQIKKQIWDFNG